MTISKIRKELKVDYWDVWNHVRSTQGTEWSSWQGAKRIITNRLNSLVTQKDPARREELKDQANECVNYLYKEAQRLGRKIESVRKTLGP